MKNIFKYISVAAMFAVLGTTTSCNKYLDLEPQSYVTPENYYKTDAQLRANLMSLYGMITVKNLLSNHGTDDMVTITPDNKFIPGKIQVPNDENANWNFQDIYNTNYFMQQAITNYQNGAISGTESTVRHCIGEGYFFRAYAYYKKWLALGDFPIITETLADDAAILTKASERRPRNEVARYILEQLDSAAVYMLDATPNDASRNLLTKNAAYMLQSRVALYEASWLKNFKGTPFVPGDDEWPGKTKAYNADFKFVAGSIDAEIEFFLDKAIESSDKVASTVALTPNSGITPQKAGDVNQYFDMFGDSNMAKYPEIIFWKASNRATEKYAGDINVGLTKSCFSTGITRGAVMSYLDRKGLPWYASTDFTNDDDLFVARNGVGATKDNIGEQSLRDLRIGIFLKVPGQVNIYINPGMLLSGVINEPAAPQIANQDKATTGYLQRKGLNPDGANNSKMGAAENGEIVFRAAEAYLNYVEAYYMRHGNLGGNCQLYWNQIRTRAGIEENSIQTTIDALDIAKEAKYDWAAYTAGKLLTDNTLFAIRKERRSEFLAEDIRLLDLKRWRAFDQMTTTPYHIQGFKLWSGANYDLYSDDPDANPDVVPNITSKAALVQGPGEGGIVSAKGTFAEDGDYLYPFRILSTMNGYNGLVWKMANYLEPIGMQHMNITSTADGGLESSPIYQNPYWPSTAGGVAIK